MTDTFAGPNLLTTMPAASLASRAASPRALPAYQGRALGWFDLGITNGSRDYGTELDGPGLKCESESMTRATQRLLDEFEALPNEDRAELVAELLRRTALAPHEVPADDDLVAAADRLFAELDRHEQA